MRCTREAILEDSVYIWSCGDRPRLADRIGVSGRERIHTTYERAIGGTELRVNALYIMWGEEVMWRQRSLEENQHSVASQTQRAGLLPEGETGPRPRCH